MSLTHSSSRRRTRSLRSNVAAGREDVWQQRLASIPASEVVTNSTDRDAIWTLYVGVANTDYRLGPTPTTSPEWNDC